MDILGRIFKNKQNTLSTKKVKLVESKLELTQEEIDCILAEIKSYFLDFRNILLKDKVDFTKLQEEDLAILRGCRINLGISLPSGYTCKIEKLSSTHVFYRIVRIDFKETTINYVPGKLVSTKWTDFEEIFIEDCDIDISKAVLNLATESVLYLNCSDYQFSNEVAKLTNEIINEITSEHSVDFNTLNIDDDTASVNLDPRSVNVI